MSDPDLTWVDFENLEVGMQVGPTCKITHIFPVTPAGLKQIEVTGGHIWEVIIGCFVLPKEDTP